MIAFTLIPSGLLDALDALVPAFSALGARARFALAAMLWSAPCVPWRQHAAVPGAAWFERDEIRAAFGVGQDSFERSNGRTGLFDVLAHDQAAGLTRAYLPSAAVQEALAQFVGERSLGQQILRASGTGFRRASKADIRRPILARDAQARPVEPVAGSEGLGAIRIDLARVDRLSLASGVVCAELEDGFDIPGGLVLGEHLPRMRRVHDAAVRVAAMARTDLCETGALPARYQQSASGRLYGLGVSLQSVPRPVRAAALHGCWSYDLHCAHFAIVAQLARRFGVSVPAIEAYVRDKRSVREVIASDAGITLRQVKTCLLALLFGARLNLWEASAIPKAIGKEPARRLFACAAFAALAGEVKAARSAIVAGWPQTHKGYLLNACGLGIHRLEKPEVILAHLTQGAEALALRSVIAIAQGQISLLEHDGWSVRERMDVAAVERSISDATGLSLHVEEKLIEADSEDPFDWALEA